MKLPSGSVLLYDEIGGHNAASTAEVLTRKGCLVEMATHDVQIGQEIGTTNKPIHLRELYKAGVVMTPNMELIEIYPEGNRLVAALRNTMTDAEEERVVDRVVVDHGTLPVDGLYRAMGHERRDPARPQFTDHCFTGDYPTSLTDMIGESAKQQISLLAEAG